MKVQKNTVPLSKKFANSFLLLTRVFTIELSYRYITIPISEFSRQPCSYNSFTSKFIQYINFAIPRRSDKIFDVVNICIFLKFLSRIIGTMKESSSSKFLGVERVSLLLNIIVTYITSIGLLRILLCAQIFGRSGSLKRTAISSRVISIESIQQKWVTSL